MTDRHCLSEDEVIRFVEGSIDASELASIETHLSTCDRCPSVVAALADDSVDEASREDSQASVGDVPSGVAEKHPGDQVGRYKILRTVGQGAMGRVYAAHDPALNRVVALKLLHPRLATRRLEARLEREAQAMARLSHPEVVAVYDAGRDGDQLFIAMELVEGQTLRQWQQERPRPWREVIDVYLRAARGLAQAHATGLVHRDFKPDNVLIATDGRVRVTDFGLARISGSSDFGATLAAQAMLESSPDDTIERSLTRTGMLLGTPAYMAPEQMRGAPADERSDVYAFCLALWEALYRERPFAGTTLATLLAEKLAEKVTDASANSEVPKAVRRALLVGLKAAPDERFASAGAMITALEAAAAKPSRGRPVAAAIALALLAASPFAWRATKRMSAGAAPIAGTSASLSAAVPKCSNKACAESHGGKPWVCRPSDGQCVSVESEDCTASYEPGDLLAEDTVWLGAMFPTKGPRADEFGTMNVETVEMARKEIAEATSGLTGLGASRHVRRIALVSCDDSSNAHRAALHLTNEVRVPAVIGFGTAQEAIDLAGQVLIPRQILVLNAVSENPLITRVPQPMDVPRLVWQTTSEAHESAHAAAAFVETVLTRRTTRRDDPTRVTFIVKKSSVGDWYADELHRSLLLDGVPAVQAGARYQELTLSDGSPSTLGTAAQKTAAHSPHVVMFAGQGSEEDTIVRQIEEGWPVSHPRPVYLVVNCETAGLSKFIGGDSARRHRVFAICLPSNEPNTVRFVQRFNSSHTRQVDNFLNASPAYDAFYTLAYATFSIGSGPVDGPTLSQGIGRLVPPGQPIDVGPLQTFDALSTLDRGASLDLRGAAGSLDFVRETGSAPTDYALLCPALAATGLASGTLESGVFYRAARRAVEGTLHCP